MPHVIAFLSFVFVVFSNGGITSQADAVSLHSYAWECCGYVGILAHEDLAGASFYQLKEGDIITLTYPDEVKQFVVTDTQLYLALIRDNYSVPIDTPTYITPDGIPTTGREMFYGIYGRNSLVLQTCYNGLEGRYFVMAQRIFEERKDVR